MSCWRPLTAWISVFAAAAVMAAATPARAGALRVEYDDIPRLVRDGNRGVVAAGLAVDAEAAREGDLRRSFLPVLGFEGGYESFTTGAYGAQSQSYGVLEGRLSLYRGGRDRWRENFQRSIAAGARAAAGTGEARSVEVARRNFLLLVHAREVAGIVAEAREENEGLLERAERRIRRGLATEADRLEFEIAASQLKEDAESYAHSQVQLTLTLSAAVGLDPVGGLETPLALDHRHDDELLARPFDPGGHPDVAALTARRDGSLAQAALAERWWAPQIEAYAGHHLYTQRERDYRSSALRDDFVVGGRLALRLFDGGAEHAEARASRLEAEGIGAGLSQLRRDLGARVRVVVEELKHDHELVHFAEERIAMARRYFSATLDEYDRGVKNSLDVLSAARRLSDYRRELAERKRDYQLTRAILLRERGL